MCDEFFDSYEHGNAFLRVTFIFSRFVDVYIGVVSGSMLQSRCRFLRVRALNLCHTMCYDAMCKHLTCSPKLRDSQPSKSKLKTGEKEAKAKQKTNANKKSVTKNT